jgi:hypothetical protein
MKDQVHPHVEWLDLAAEGRKAVGTAVLLAVHLQPCAARSCLYDQQVVEKQVSGRQPRRAAFWDAQHTDQYVSNHKSRATPDHGPRRRFSSTC